jgi:hypothetical protein
MRTLSAFVLMLICYSSSAQFVRDQDICYRKSIVKELNLRHPMNAAVFGKQSLFSKILLEAAMNGQIASWNPDTLSQRLTTEQITTRISYSNDSGATERYFLEDLYIVEITEDLVFDKNRSEFRVVPQRITLFVPASVSTKGILEPVASWTYEDCLKIWKNDSRARYAPDAFQGPSYSFEQVFILGNYRAEIVKIGNLRDLYFDQMYGDPYQAMMARQEAENQLLELMHAAYNPE